MIRVIPADQRYHADFGWLSTYWHFSFSDYYDPGNVNWGALRVFNDDTVQPGQGFGSHSHRDMEIITVVLEGALEHKDSLGNVGVLRPGEVQVMSAGSGIAHSEYNYSKTDPLHFHQLWILPRRKGSKPRWEQREFPAPPRTGKLLPVVSSGEIAGTLAIDQDAQIYLSRLQGDQQAVHSSRPGRRAYLFVIRGAVELNGERLAQSDQARVADETQLTMRAQGEAEFILLDLPA